MPRDLPPAVAWWAEDVAEYYGWKVNTVYEAASRGRIPAPDGRFRNSPWWWPQTIREARRDRPANTEHTG